MLKKLYTISIFALLSLTLQAQWKAFGSMGFSVGISHHHSIAFHPGTDEAYVAFKDDGSAGKLTVMKYDGSSWVLVGAAGFTPGTAEFISLAFHPGTHEPFVAFTDGDVGGLTSVMAFDGSAWGYVGSAGFSVGPGFYHSLVFHPSSHEPFVAFQDMGPGVGGKGVLMTFDGTTWGLIGGVPFSVAMAFETTLIFHPATEDPIVGYEDDSVGGKATVMMFDGGSGMWVPLGPVGFSSGISAGHSIAIDAVGDLYLCYIDLFEGSKLTVMVYDPGMDVWDPVGIPGFTPSSASFPSLAFKPGTTIPYVAFVDLSSADYVSVMTFDAGAWSMFGMSGFSPGMAAYTDMAFHPGTGDPYVVFADDAASGKTSVMWFDPAGLPVEWLSFDAKLDNNKVDLNWATATELNNDYFIIQRSVDGKDFTDIGIVKGNVNSEVIQRYAFTDEHIAQYRSAVSTIYYRLKQVDLDRRFDYSDIVSVKFESVEFNVYPNPSFGQVELLFPESIESNIELSNINGKILLTQPVLGSYAHIDISHLPAGVYYLTLPLQGEMVTRKIVLID